MLYAITPPTLDPLEFVHPLQAVLKTGIVSHVQLRLKESDDQTIETACRVLRPIVHAYQASFILNDHPLLALKTGCDGVHLGQSDMAYDLARSILGADKIIGISCHDSLELGLKAAAQGADYVAFGAFFPTLTKPSPYSPPSTLLTEWKRLSSTPCVAIGGITPETCRALVEAGADYLAVVSALWDHPQGVTPAIQAFQAAIASLIDS